MRRNAIVVPVIDAAGNKLYEVDRQTAIDHIKSGLAFSVHGRAICMRTPGRRIPGGPGHLAAGSPECWPTSIAVMRRDTPDSEWGGSAN